MYSEIRDCQQLSTLLARWPVLLEADVTIEPAMIEFDAYLVSVVL